jgi:hypothetical protein
MGGGQADILLYSDRSDGCEQASRERREANFWLLQSIEPFALCCPFLFPTILLGYLFLWTIRGSLETSIRQRHSCIGIFLNHL